jgi:hypothetical protein
VIAPLVIVAGVVGLVWTLLFRQFVELMYGHESEAWQALGSIARGGYRISVDEDVVRQGDQLRLLFLTDVLVVAGIVVTVLREASGQM